jgi:hypothetical protein
VDNTGDRIGIELMPRRVGLSLVIDETANTHERGPYSDNPDAGYT